MRFYHPLSYILDNRIKVNILRFLVKTTAEWNGREIAKELKISPAACHQALKSLQREGVVFLRTTGNTHLYRLNQLHLITKNLLAPLFEWEIQGINNLITLIHQRIKRYDMKGFVSLALFGSIIAGKEKPNSDIDLFIIIKNSAEKEKAEELSAELGSFLLRKTGNTLSPYIQTAEEFRSKYRRKLAVIIKVVKRCLPVWGKPIKDLL